VESYLVKFKPANEEDDHYVSMSVPGATLDTVLPHLVPLTRYEVNVHAQYDKGDSLPVTGFETTTEGMLTSRRHRELKPRSHAKRCEYSERFTHGSLLA